MEFGVDVPQVRIHGVIAATELVGDFLFDQPFGHQFQNPLFPRGQHNPTMDDRMHLPIVITPADKNITAE